MSVFAKYKVVCDDDLMVFEGKQARFKAARGGIEKCVMMHDTKESPALLKKILGFKGGVRLRSLLLFSADGDVMLDTTSTGFEAALDWLRTDGWQVDEAMDQSRQSPQVRTFVRKL